MHSDAKSPNISIHVGAATPEPEMPTGEVHVKMRDLVAEQDELVAAICELDARLATVLAACVPSAEGPVSSACHTALGGALEDAVIRTVMMRQHVQMIISRLEL